VTQGTSLPIAWTVMAWLLAGLTIVGLPFWPMMIGLMQTDPTAVLSRVSAYHWVYWIGLSGLIAGGERLFGTAPLRGLVPALVGAMTALATHHGLTMVLVALLHAFGGGLAALAFADLLAQACGWIVGAAVVVFLAGRTDPRSVTALSMVVFAASAGTAGFVLDPPGWTVPMGTVLGALGMAVAVRIGLTARVRALR